MNIQLTETAQKTFYQITSKYSDSQATKFSIKTVAAIEIIATNNCIGLRHKKTSFRKFLISNQVYLFYKIQNEILFIILFWDNKRNPLDLEVILSF